ncbi:hypothetical protein Zmor_022204 [Zophobas morio]|uniref:Uncharacterized protein n=1 Tax=Zophobas morio TaxID=2755281 RepID=A0AA38HVD6_9CUCU|nr:hypothetical protein Zmor_022204 [Zophobas morio]
MDIIEHLETPSLFQRITRAINAEDFEQVKTLLRPDVPVQELKDASNDTLIHIAVRIQNLEILEYILDLKIIDINSYDYMDQTPLVTAVLQNCVKVTKMLIVKGADVNLGDPKENSPLHYAVYHALEDECLLLLKNGANVNAQNYYGCTPLHAICGVHSEIEIAAMLMYYGADVTVRSWNDKSRRHTPFDLCLVYGRSILQRFLSDYVFDGVAEVSVSLGGIMGAMQHNPGMFFDIIDKISDVVVDVQDLMDFMNKILLFNPKCLRVFINRFKNVLESIALLDDERLFTSICAINGQVNARRAIDNFYTILEEPALPYFVEHLTSDFLSCLFHMKVPQKEVEGLFFHLLSCGCPLTNTVLDTVYHYYGDGEFFRTLLFMDIEKSTDCHQRLPPFPAIIYDVDIPNVNNFIYLLRFKDCENAQKVEHFFAGVHIKNAYFTSGEQQLIEIAQRISNVPSLLELARNDTRNHIIRHYGITNSRQFYDVIRLLPILEEYKGIITFKKRLYYY